MVVDAVVFDVGETLVDETREHGTWADWLGRVPRTPSRRYSARSSHWVWTTCSAVRQNLVSRKPNRRSEK